MNGRLAGAYALLAAAALCGCNQSAGTGGSRLALTGTGYCAPFRGAAANANSLAAAASTDPAAAVDDCVHRWAYALAPDAEGADTVAQAVMNACSPVLTNWSQQLGAQAQASPPDQAQGQSVAQQNPGLAQRMGMAEGRALFYVVQARSAGCGAPPANSLPPAPGLNG